MKKLALLFLLVLLTSCFAPIAFAAKPSTGTITNGDILYSAGHYLAGTPILLALILTATTIRAIFSPVHTLTYTLEVLVFLHTTVTQKPILMKTLPRLITGHGHTETKL